MGVDASSKGGAGVLRRALSLIINLAIALIALSAWAGMTFTVDKHGQFSAGGLENLKYFTVLSNLLQGVVSACCAWRLFTLLLGGRRPFPPGLIRMKYMATTSVALTFFTVLGFLGPVFGYENMYQGANFWFHLVVPVLSMVDFCLVDREGTVKAREIPFAALPMLLYGLFYVGNLRLNGVGRGADTYDWYGFARGGPKTAATVFLILTLSGLVLAALLRLPRRARGRKKRFDVTSRNHYNG